jgi:hypothetical protein
MAPQPVDVLAFDPNSNVLPIPRNSSGGNYVGGSTMIADANIASVLTASAVMQALAERDEAIQQLRESLSKLEARLQPSNGD